MVRQALNVTDSYRILIEGKGSVTSSEASRPMISRQRYEDALDLLMLIGSRALDMVGVAPTDQMSGNYSVHEVRQAAQRYFQSLLAFPERLAAVAAASYNHDNGFTKLVIASAPAPVAEIRLHLWGDITDGAADRQWDASIHDHSADFASHVLRGGMEEETFALLPDGTDARDEGTYRAFACGSRGSEEYTMASLGLARLQLASRRTYVAGDWHTLRYDELHRLRTTDNTTVTMFFQGARRQRGTRVYCSPDLAWPPRVASPALEVDRVATLITRVLDLMEN